MKSALHKPENGTPPRMRYAAVGAAAVIVLLFALPAVLGWGGVSVRAGADARRSARLRLRRARAHAALARAYMPPCRPRSPASLPPLSPPLALLSASTCARTLFPSLFGSR